MVYRCGCGSHSEIGTVLDEAMREIEAENKSLKNVLPKNYASPDLDKRVLGDVVDLFTNMDMSDTEEGKDLLGRAMSIASHSLLLTKV